MGLARASHMEAFQIFSSYAQDDETDIIISSLGITAILDPICPKPLFSAAFRARNAKIAKPHRPHEEGTTSRSAPEGGRIRPSLDLASFLKAQPENCTVGDGGCEILENFSAEQCSGAF